MKKRRVTNAEFELFRDSVREFVELFGLREWRVYVKKDNEMDDHTFGECRHDSANKICTIAICGAFYEKKSHPFMPRQIALHEVIHLAIDNLVWVARCRYVRPDDVEEQCEVTTRRIQNVVQRLLGEDE